MIQAWKVDFVCSEKCRDPRIALSTANYLFFFLFTCAVTQKKNRTISSIWELFKKYISGKGERWVN